MNAALIGLIASLINILIFTVLKQINKNIVYGLILMGIAFLYIGYTWTDINTAILSFVQMLFFLVFAYMGIKRSYLFLVAGYILHGVWDMLYPFLASPDLLPPHYDYFCMTYDFIIGVYLFILNYRQTHHQELGAKQLAE